MVACHFYRELEIHMELSSQIWNRKFKLSDQATKIKLELFVKMRKTKLVTSSA
jgi:hypothetical protein